MSVSVRRRLFAVLYVRRFPITILTQLDWYLGWLDGALRLAPGGELRLGSFVLPSVFFVGVGLPLVLLGLLFASPSIECRFTKDARRHELLQWPYENPFRTSLGMAFIGFVFVLFLAHSDDVQAATFHVSLDALIRAYRVMVFAVPLGFGIMTYSACRIICASKRELLESKL